MKIIRHLWLLLVLLAGVTSAQNITNAEYYFDHDPGLGQGIALPSFSAANTVNLIENIPTTGLQPGIHYLFIRSKNTNSTWSIILGREFLIGGTAAQTIVKAEYYFDHDPGLGNGFALPSFTAANTINLMENISTTGLQSGVHYLFIRAKNDSGTWSIILGREFLIAGTAGLKIVKAEYFYDTDPGVGKATPVTPSFTPAVIVDTIRNLPTAPLCVGTHYLFMRAQNNAGMWSVALGDTFDIVCPTVSIISGSRQMICKGDSTTLTASGGTAYTWSPATGLSATMGDSVIANPTVTTIYTINGTGSCACASTITDTVKVSSLLALTILPESPSVCDGQSVILKASGGTTYLWVGTTNTTNTITVNPSKDTAYELIVSNGGCSKDTLISVNVINAPPITILPQGPVFCSGLSVTLSILGGGSGFVWNPSTGLSTTTGDSVVASPTISTTYTVTGNDSLGCASTGTDIVTVIPSPNKPSFTQHNDTLISSSKHDNQWYRNDTLLQNDTSQYLIITILGQYWVTVLNEVNGCSTSSDSITGINQLLVINNQLSIYPNPTSGQFTISLQSNQNGYSLEVYDILGKEIYKSVLYSSQDIINLSAQPSGMYFVYLKSEEGVEIGKILVTK